MNPPSAMEAAKILIPKHYPDVDSMVFPDYNWKQHSTGWLLKFLRSFYSSYDRSRDDPIAVAVRAELSKRPHIRNKKESYEHRKNLKRNGK